MGDTRESSVSAPPPPSSDTGENAAPLPLHRSVASSLRRCFSALLIHLVLLYRVTLGRLLGGQCRYQPTCSQYAIDAIHKHGPWRGGWRALKRISRCHPWGGGGYDPA